MSQPLPKPEAIEKMSRLLKLCWERELYKKESDHSSQRQGRDRSRGYEHGYAIREKLKIPLQLAIKSFESIEKESDQGVVLAAKLITQAVTDFEAYFDLVCLLNLWVVDLRCCLCLLNNRSCPSISRPLPCHHTPHHIKPGVQTPTKPLNHHGYRHLPRPDKQKLSNPG
jgi:hypothetical protein